MAISFFPERCLPNSLFRLKGQSESSFAPRLVAALVLSIWTNLILASPTLAQRGGTDQTPPSSSAPEAARPTSADAMAHLVSNAIPTTYFITTASRMAMGKTHNGKLLKLAETLVKEQTPAGASLAPFVNVNNAVVTLRSPFTGKVGPGARRLAAPNLLPSQAADLRTLSSAQNGKFDDLYVSTVMAALVQLQALYRDYSLAGTDEDLKAIVTRELPKVEQSLSAFEAL